MFCPQCKAEYREGFYRCSDCDIDLVDSLPPEPPPEYVDFQPILATFNTGDIAVIKSILDGEEITYYFLGEHINLVRPLGDPARLMVRSDQVETAIELLKDLKFSFTALNVHDEEEVVDDENDEDT